MAVIELVTFRLATGVDEDEFLDADRRAQTEFLYRQPGLLRRTTARGEASQWLVVSSWGSAADADASAEASRHHAAAARLDACLDPSSVVSNRYQTID